MSSSPHTAPSSSSPHPRKGRSELRGASCTHLCLSTWPPSVSPVLGGWGYFSFQVKELWDLVGHSGLGLRDAMGGGGKRNGLVGRQPTALGALPGGEAGICQVSPQTLTCHTPAVLWTSHGCSGPRSVTELQGPRKWLRGSQNLRLRHVGQESCVCNTRDHSSCRGPTPLPRCLEPRNEAAKGTEAEAPTSHFILLEALAKFPTASWPVPKACCVPRRGQLLMRT